MDAILALMAGTLSSVKNGLERMGHDAGEYRDDVNNIHDALEDVCAKIYQLDRRISRDQRAAKTQNTKEK